MITDKKNPHRYNDMLTMPHPVSKSHLPMDASKRAAQFAPFAALTGYEEAVSETGRLTDSRIELEEDQKEILDEKFRHLMECSDSPLEITITAFVPDKKKAGGAYVSIAGKIQKLDTCTRQIFMENGTAIPIDNIIDIEVSSHGIR